MYIVVDCEEEPEDVHKDAVAPYFSYIWREVHSIIIPDDDYLGNCAPSWT